MLRELSLENFKSWRDIKKMRLAPVTGLFGTNSSGKTSILQFLLMLKQTVESSDFSQVLNFGDEKNLVALGTFGDVVHNRDGASSIKWEIKWSVPNTMKLAVPTDKEEKVILEASEIALETEVACTPAGKLHVRNLKYKLGCDEFSLKHKPETLTKYDLSAKSDKFSFVRGRGRPWDLPPPIKFYGFPYEVRSHYQNADFLWDLVFAFEMIFRDIYYLRPLRENPRRQYIWAGGRPDDVGQRGEKVIDAILAAGQTKISRGRGNPKMTLEEYVVYWLKELGLVNHFEVQPITKENNLYEVWIKKSESGTRVRITDVGFGVSQVLPVLVLCYYVPEGSIVLLEQPEIHLHPSAQSGLADVFIDAIKTRNIQIILESHSEHLLRRLQRRIAEEKITKEDIALYFCDVKNGASNLVPLEMDLLGDIINWPKEFFGDMFGEVAATEAARMRRKPTQTCQHS